MRKSNQYTPNSLGIAKPVSETRVVVAMSGGVDSSTVAALLKEEGYEVIGVTLQLYDHGQALAKKGACCAGQDIHDARRVSEALGIPHYVLDYESKFKESVIEDFADTYLLGATPIPCVRCNQTVKFRDLLTTARDLGADVLATGHYVRRTEGKNGAELHCGSDSGKDQSYFLFTTTPEQLDFLRFPIGGMEKSETRGHADRFKLAVADKPESQDICFVPDGNYARIVENLRPGAADPGDIIDIDGNVRGQHKGIIHYTIGQRRGLGIAAADPLYVVRLDPKSKQVIVGPKEALLREHLVANDINWLGEGELPEDGTEVDVKIRSTSPPVAATLSRLDTGRLKVTFKEKQGGVAPGQACVFYNDSKVLGGGWIEREA